jgi:hypothetical protein
VGVSEGDGLKLKRVWLLGPWRQTARLGRFAARHCTVGGLLPSALG